MPRTLVAALAVLPALAAGLLLSGAGSADTNPAGRPAAAERKGTVAADLSVDVAGKGVVPLRELLGKAKATAFVFVGVSCPIANGSAPELAAIGKRAATQGGQLVLVYSNPGEQAGAAAHAAKFGLGGVARILDTHQRLADALGAKVTPEAFVVDARGTIRYAGRLNDAYIERSKPRGTGKVRRDLALALDATLAGKPVPAATTRAIGCVIERPRPVATGPTYSGEVAAILNENCVTCHRDGEIGPMKLDSYERARKFAANIASVTQSKTMPPWKPVEGHGDFSGVRRLSPDQIAVLSDWAKAGAPAGDLSRTPAPPKFVKGWRLGQPDLVLSMPVAWNVPASGGDDYRCFVLPTGLTEDKEVVAVEYRAGNKSVVHHVLGYVDTMGKGRKKDADDEAPGYTSFGGPGFVPTGEMGGWAPGNLPQFLPDGIARPLPKGSDLILQVHYHPSGKPETDVTQVGIYFAKKPITKHLRLYPLFAPLNIPAGEARYTTEQTLPVPFDARALFVAPHMHLLGREIQVTATLPDGTIKPMVRIEDWDFNWQDTYAYKEPVVLPKGSRLTLSAVYDNSSKNPRQPANPPRAVGWGEATTDEMCIAFVGLIAEKEDDPMVKMMDGIIRTALQDDGVANRLLREGIGKRQQPPKP